MFGTDTPLHSLLIKPVQRIAKYPLLMKVEIITIGFVVTASTKYCDFDFGPQFVGVKGPSFAGHCLAKISILGQA